MTTFYIPNPTQYLNLKGYMKILSLITYPHVFPNLFQTPCRENGRFVTVLLTVK